MNAVRRLDLSRFGQDKGFWIFVLVILVLLLVLQTQSAIGLVLSLAALLLAITVHECSHAWAANRLGDPTAANVGRISLNPLRHLDPMGTVMMLITTLTGFGIGWGKPVPVATFRLRYGPRIGNGIVSLAGPAANIATALVFSMAIRLLGLWTAVPAIVLWALSYVVLLNLVIAFFNLLPIPPLDGYAVAIAAISLIRGDWARHLVVRMEQLYRYGWMILFAVILITQLTGLGVLDVLVGGPAYGLLSILTGL